MIWYLKVKVFHSQMAEAFSAVDWRPYFWVCFDDYCLQTGPCGMQASGTTPRTGTDHQDIALLRCFAHGMIESGEAHEANGWFACFIQCGERQTLLRTLSP
jgi:hypothetical protein